MASEPSDKVFLVVGTHRCGKTSLARRICEGAWVDGARPTIGLDDVGSVVVKPDGERLRDDLHILVPERGIGVRFLEIGGMDFNLRSAPRGQKIDGLLLCFDVGDRNSFHTAAHILMKHRADRHLAHERAAVASRVASPPRLVVVLCGVRADVADQHGGHAVSTSEQLSFMTQNNLDGTFVTSAKTGECIEEAFQALLVAALEAEEEAEACRVEGERAPPVSETWSLPSRGTIPDSWHHLQNLPSEQLVSARRDLPTMTSPRGLRPHEPLRGVRAAAVVEVLNNQGEAYGARPLATCLERGLLHRVVHVWLCDPRIGGLLLRRYSPTSTKWPRKWGPSAAGEVLCYQPDTIEHREGQTYVQNAELSMDAARRVLRDQLGVQHTSIEHWLSCTSERGNVREVQEVFAVDIAETKLEDLEMRTDEAIEWVHFTDVFGSEGARATQLFHIVDKYRVGVVLKMRSRIQHSHLLKDSVDSAALAQSWLDCPLPAQLTEQEEQLCLIDCQ